MTSRVDTRLDYLRKEKLHKILVSDFLVRELGFRFWLNACGCGVCVCVCKSFHRLCLLQSIRKSIPDWSKSRALLCFVFSRVLPLEQPISNDLYIHLSRLCISKN